MNTYRWAGLAAMSTLSAFATDLEWPGTATSGSWTGESAWITCGTFAPATFADGDNTAVNNLQGGTTITVEKTVNPGDVVVDSDKDVTFYFPNYVGFGAQTKSIVKRGSGTLTFSYPNSGWSFENCKNTCDIDIYGGTLTSAIRANYGTFGDARQPFTVRVHDGGRFWLQHHATTVDIAKMDDAVGGGNMSVVVDSGGIFEANPIGSGNGINAISYLTLNGGTFLYGNGFGPGRAPLEVRRGIVFGGNAPYVFDRDEVRGGNQAVALHTHTEELARGNNKVEVRVPDLSDDASADVTFNIPFTRTKYATLPVGLRKTGAGHLVMGATPGMADFDDDIPGDDTYQGVNGGVVVEEGVLELANRAVINPIAGQEVFVSTGAEMRVSSYMALCDRSSDRGICTTGDVAVTVSHGTLKLTDSAAEATYLGSLTLDYADFTFQEKGSGLGKLHLGRKLKIADDHPIAWESDRTSDGIRLFASDEIGTEIDVSTTPGNRVYDFCLGTAVGYGRSPKDELICYRSSIVKTGDGILALNNFEGTYAGDIRVMNGTLALGKDGSDKGSGTELYSLVGDLRGYPAENPVQRKIYVNTNAALRIYARNFLPGIAKLDPKLYPMTVHVCGLMSIESSSSFNAFPNLTMEDCTFAHRDGNSTYGLMKIIGTFKVTGRKRQDLLRTPGMAWEWIALNGGSFTTFDIGDNTGDSAVDANFEIGLGVPIGGEYFDDASQRHKAQIGFIKKGMGTMRYAALTQYAGPLNAPIDCSPNGPISVTEGALQVDGNLSRSTVIQVSAGAYVSGTGLVSNVTLAGNAGFQMAAGQKAGLQICGDLSLPATGVIDVCNPDGLPADRLRGKVATVAGTLTGPTDLSQWMVKINGVKTTDLVPRFRGKEIVVGNNCGFSITVR